MAVATSPISGRGDARSGSAGFKPQYVEIRAPDLGLPRRRRVNSDRVAAAYLGTTRLIDNVINRWENIWSWGLSSS